MSNERLEDIKLELGDKITFDDGQIRFVGNQYPCENSLRFYDTSKITKVERYVKLDQHILIGFDNNAAIYESETIWEKKEILTEEEKEYLRAVIKPFRDKIEYIVKREHAIAQYISIHLQTIEPSITFPDFDRDKIYKGMELDKEYTLEELGL